MQLREIMTRDVEVIRPETSVSEAAQKMRSLDLALRPPRRLVTGSCFFAESVASSRPLGLDPGRGNRVARLIRMVFGRSKEMARLFKRELRIYQRVLKDERTPARAKIFLGLAIAYLCMPFDLIPDFIPVIGHLDDAVIIPALVFVALRSVPREVVSKHREHVIREQRHFAVAGPTEKENDLSREILLGNHR
jgi:uncharacterized membrane protein YkvA (DUF1232 family)